MRRKNDTRWLNALEDKVKQNLLLKRMMSITIFGSFSQKSNLLLRKLKDNLIENGYQNTRLISDYPDEGLPIIEISKIVLELSDVNFFIFTHDGTKYGLLAELEYALTSRKPKNCVIFDELYNDKPSLSKLVIGQIKTDSLERVPYVHFKNAEELFKVAQASAWKFSSEFLGDLKNRSPTLKERTSNEGEFNEIVADSIDEVFASLGENAKSSIYFHLETKFNLSKEDIPNRLDEFDTALDEIFGNAGNHLEKMIIDKLREKVGDYQSIRRANSQPNLKEYSDSIKTQLVSLKEKEK